MPVTNGERRKVTRQQVNSRKKKKAFERLQRNTNQRLTRSLRSQLSIETNADGTYAAFNEKLLKTRFEGGQGDQKTTNALESNRTLGSSE
mmetsp:Transcript_29575/g.41230  ORF Transcript_29575/g.41230 Transcript_29575/m.41230 type:complete len:90 (+) Transcript_29575:432-701(+)